MAEEQADSISEPHAAYGQPEPQTISRVERLIASGRLKAATVDLLALGRPQDADHELSISQALNEQRAEC